VVKLIEYILPMNLTTHNCLTKTSPEQLLANGTLFGSDAGSFPTVLKNRKALVANQRKQM